ncbi:MAG TPA: adenylate/guanylate cyclase domain-containing protein [Candidatus Cybelea sp.]|jgi:predicted ATPase/class 3 adenylate cyclase|nr:adenylate/guanylate cyclase domain-containing protein [Candidatus Cybelea sp.]
MALRAPLPSGTVTLLFTDIEGSTQHWEERPDEMALALRRHDELLRTTIEVHGGHVFKTMGDQFCAAFWRASDAIAAADDAQRALASEDWSAVGGLAVRMALHSGATDERGGDYFGPVVNRVARLLSIAHGGQTIVSGVTALQLRGLMSDHTELRDLGEHRLKDLIESEHVWQLVVPDLRDTFPPLLSLGSLPNNLPRQVTALIGREEVLAEIESLVQGHPLVTLVGTGGVGKTRLALQTGADLLDGSADGAWFVELAPLSDPALIVNTIAATFGLREQANRSFLDVLLQYLRPRRLLLILDNCEHLIEAVAKIADAILRAAPQVRMLATSREPLRIAAEHVYRVPSLAVPPDNPLTSDEALQHGAIALFAERARASDGKFMLSDETAPIVADICRRLDGIALAIELAAARVRMLPPRQLAQKLDERFRVLTGGSRSALPRQQTMRALIDWSHDLLAEPEQRLFRRLAIFVGGWTLEAAEAVCTDETLDAFDVTDLLSSLVDKSLVVAEAENLRYTLLESTRAFALEKLAESGEREALVRRHAQWAANLGDHAYETLWTIPRLQWFAQFDPEIENARFAVDWALSHDEILLAARILAGFSSPYQRLIGALEVSSRLELVLERLDAAAQPAVAAHVWWAVARLSVGPRTVEAAQRALELAERCNDTLTTIDSLSRMAFGLLQAGRPQEAQPVIDRALRRSEGNGLTRSLIHVSALIVAEPVARLCGRVPEAGQTSAEALALATELGEELQALQIRGNMAELEFQKGNAAGALELVEAIEVQTHGRRTDLTRIQALVNGAAYRIALGDIPGARSVARDVLRLARGVQLFHATIAIQHLATVAALSGDAPRGARLRGYVDALYRNTSFERELTEQRTYEILVTALREKLSDAEIESLAAEGAQLSEDQAVAEALTV